WLAFESRPIARLPRIVQLSLDNSVSVNRLVARPAILARASDKVCQTVTADVRRRRFSRKCAALCSSSVGGYFVNRLAMVARGPMSPLGGGIPKCEWHHSCMSRVCHAFATLFPRGFER